MIVDARTNGRQCPVGRACCTITRLNHNLIDAFESGALLQGPQTDFLKLHRGSYLAPYNFTSHCSPSSSTLPDIPVARTAPASFRRFISLGERGNTLPFLGMFRSCNPDKQPTSTTRRGFLSSRPSSCECIFKTPLRRGDPDVRAHRGLYVSWRSLLLEFRHAPHPQTAAHPGLRNFSGLS